MTSVQANTLDPADLRAQVLIVEDELDHADVMADALRKPGHVCTITNSAAEALEELKGGGFDLVVTDLRMPNSAGVSSAIDNADPHTVAHDGANAGLVVLEAARKLQPNAETIMVTAHGDVPTARLAFKHGVFDFIEKPLDLELFRSLVNRAAEVVLLRHYAAQEGLPDEASDAGIIQHEGFEGIIAGSEAMRKIIQTVKTVAAAKIPVLITGESGTGKELIAQAIHRNSPRTKERFVPFNCAGQSESLLESELFGHAKGAFTGADRDREGVFEYADKGTLFLDELGDMPLTMQSKLLRVLENNEVVRVGANDPRKIDVRFVSATNKDLEQASKDGEFRQDLYFRIKGAHVHLPPLRERREDIPRIVRHAVASAAAEMNQPPLAVTDAAMMRLTAYAWPGNVRQLLNAVQTATVMAIGDAAANDHNESTLDTNHIPPEITSDDSDDAPDAPGDIHSLAGTSLESLEKRAIRDTLKLTAGNRERTAKLLGIGERTLYRKLKEYGLR